MKKVREKLNAKLRKSGGFTLVEMLIVVAIIAILMMVSIPMFTSTLEKARHGVDQANMRDAISMGTLEYMGSLKPDEDFKEAVTYDYIVDDADNHQARLDKGTAGTSPTNGAVLPECTDVTNKKGLQVTVKHDTTKPNNVDISLNWSFGADGHIDIS